MLSALASLGAVLAAIFVLVPLDDRPVTLQLPRLLGAIAGVQISAPPRSLLGRYLTFGNPDALMHWLETDAPPDPSAYIISTDMIVYGGLVASRTPETPTFLALARLRELAGFHATRPRAWFAAFGTVMRLAPTGVPAVGASAGFFAAGSIWPAIAAFANLPDPPATALDRAQALQLRRAAGAALDAYLTARARNRDVDLFALQLLAEGSFDRLIVGQDDAGPIGLHLRDLAALRSFASRWGLRERASIEPGADELAMVLVGAALARQAAFTPRIRVHYSRPGGATLNDPLEFTPIDTTVNALIAACGAQRTTSTQADIVLYVRVPHTSDGDEAPFVNAIEHDVKAGRLVAIADLSFLQADDFPVQRSLVQTLLDRKIAGSVAAFASWNTTANTVGTAIPEAIAVAAGERMGSYDARAHAQFMLDRYADDYAFHDFTRPQLNDWLSADGIEDHTLLEPLIAEQTTWRNRSDLWPRALALLAQAFPQYVDAGLTITLPWDRTFETELDVRLDCAHVCP